MNNYVTLSLETHLFFARIMKEHSLFLEAGFPCKNENLIKQADCFRQQFESLLHEVVNISNGRVGKKFLHSDEIVTEFTIPAERRTEHLSGVPIDTQISMAEHKLQAGYVENETCELIQSVNRINKRAICLLNRLIDFKERVLQEVSNCNLFTANYPLLIRHIIREARLYRETVQQLLQNRRITRKHICETENFWNQIMMEHALFIRGLLDPSEEELIHTADDFAMD